MQAWLKMVTAVAVIIFLFIEGPAASPKPAIPAGSYTYQDRTGDAVNRFSWHLSYGDGVVEIAVEGGDYQTLNRCRFDGETVFWRIRQSDFSEIEATRDRNSLLITDGSSPKPLDTLMIDDHPWFQPLSFSLNNFLFSQDEIIEFWSVRQDTLEPVSLTARKRGVETIPVLDHEYLAVRVEVRLKGLLSRFWHGTYWYRETDGLFLKYQGKSGPPGSPDKTIVLVDAPRQAG